MTDDRRAVDWCALAGRLPSGSAVVVRSRDAIRRDALALALRPILRAKRILLLIARDWKLAIRCGADGVHAPEAMVSKLKGLSVANPRWLLTAAAHGPKGLRAAASCGADIALLSPAFATGSHADRAALGPLKWAQQRRTAGASMAVYALGGVVASNATRLERAGADGFALIGGWIDGAQ